MIVLSTIVWCHFGAGILENHCTRLLKKFDASVCFCKLEVFTAGEMFPGAAQWPSLDGGFPTYALMGYALPDGPGGPLGPSDYPLEGELYLPGCGGLVAG